MTLCLDVSLFRLLGETPANGVAKATGLPGMVQKGRVLKLTAESLRDSDQSGWIGSKLHRSPDIILIVLCDPLRVSCRRQQGDTDSAGVTISGKRDRCPAHPKGFAGRRRAVVRKCVQGNVDLMIDSKMVLQPGDPTAKLDSAGIDLVGRESRTQVSREILICQSVALQHQA